MKKIWKTSIKLGITLLMINQLITPTTYVMMHPCYPSTIKASKKKIQAYKNIPKDFTALDYVNLSNMIVNNYSKGHGDCKSHARETFNVYKQLVEQNNRLDLKKKIRTAIGTCRSWKEGMGHVWVEVEHEEEWIKYESTRNTPKLKIGQIKEYSKESIDDKTSLNGDYIKEAQTFNGTSICYPLPSSFANGGLIRLFYSLITKSEQVNHQIIINLYQQEKKW